MEQAIEAYELGGAFKAMIGESPLQVSFKLVQTTKILYVAFSQLTLHKI
jgi:hypothetical protein